MGRAVRIRKILHGKGMRDKPVDSIHQHMIQEPLHHFQAFAPPVSSENLTHGSALLQTIQRRQRCSEICQHIMEKCSVITHIAANPAETEAVHLRAQLLQYDINPRHILAFQSPEIMPRAKAQMRMRSIILNDMADVLNPVRSAPVPNLAAEIRTVESGNDIHKLFAVDRGNCKSRLRILFCLLAAVRLILNIFPQ